MIKGSVCSPDPSVSQFYLNGFRRLGADRRLLVITAAVASRLSEGAIAELFDGP